MMEETYSLSEDQLRNHLLNKIIVVSAGIAVFALISAQLRSFNIGWTFRDIFQLLVVCCFVVLALFRKSIHLRFKTLILVILLSIGGISGVYTLGLLAGTIFIFPAAAVVVAVFYSVRATLIYIGLSVLTLCLIGFRFCSGQAQLTISADSLMTNYSHWFVYIVCFAFFFAVAYITIHEYRNTMSLLIEKVSRQRDELTQTNEELRSASKNVKILSGLLPICASCKKIRDDQGYWSQLELYIKEHSEADFSHGLCPECMKKYYPKNSE